MHTNKKYITYCYLSFILLSISLIFFFLFLLLNWKWKYLYPAIPSLAGFFLLYFPSVKQLKLPEGYTVLQAIVYYFQCNKNGYNGEETQEAEKILQEIADKENLPVDHKNVKLLKNVYNTGKKNIPYITNPFVLFIWKLQGYEK